MSTNNKPRIDYIRINWEVDTDPDTSYLESKLSEDGKTLISSMRYTQQDLDESPKEIKKYIEQDTERLKKCYSGELCAYSCTAEAITSYPIGESGDRRIQKLTSGGLWGIESDSRREYKEEVATEELDDLKSHLETYGVTVPECWGEIVKEALQWMDNYETRKDSNISQWVKVPKDTAPNKHDVADQVEKEE